MNKKIRNLICNECLKRQDSYISNDMPDIFFVQESLLYYELFEGQDLIIPLYEIEIFFLNKMLSASSFSNLIELLRNDIYMQKRSVESVRNFVMSDGLSKCLLLKSIDEKLADKLKNILPLYIEDKESYDKEINKEKFINIYNNTKKFYEENEINLDPIETIKNYIMMLKIFRND